MVDEENKVLHKQRFRNELPLILAGLDPFKKDIEGVVVESTFNWSWLVDGLMDQGYRVHLANVSAIKQYEGLKQIDDQRSAFWLANLLRLGIASTGYIYPKEERPTRGNTVLTFIDAASSSTQRFLCAVFRNGSGRMAIFRSNFVPMIISLTRISIPASIVKEAIYTDVRAIKRLSAMKPGEDKK